MTLERQQQADLVKTLKLFSGKKAALAIQMFHLVYSAFYNCLLLRDVLQVARKYLLSRMEGVPGLHVPLHLHYNCT